MNAHEKGIHEAMWLEFNAPVGISEGTFRAMVNVYLEAVGDVMVVDGRVVGLKPVTRILATEEHDRPDDTPTLIDHVADCYLERLINAARQLAEGEA